MVRNGKPLEEPLAFLQRLRAANPDFGPRVDEINPDGDAELPDEVLDGFAMVDCLACGEDLLKPDVVFFGETVPRDRVDHCFSLRRQSVLRRPFQGVPDRGEREHLLGDLL